MIIDVKSQKAGLVLMALTGNRLLIFISIRINIGDTLPKMSLQ